MRRRRRRRVGLRLHGRADDGSAGDRGRRRSARRVARGSGGLALLGRRDVHARGDARAAAAAGRRRVHRRGRRRAGRVSPGVVGRGRADGAAASTCSSSRRARPWARPRRGARACRVSCCDVGLDARHGRSVHVERARDPRVAQGRASSTSRRGPRTTSTRALAPDGVGSRLVGLGIVLTASPVLFGIRRRRLVDLLVAVVLAWVLVCFGHGVAPYPERPGGTPRAAPPCP